jgi:hypothetical protein
MSYIGRDIRTGAFRQLDDISSGFDGSDTTHTMQVNSTNVSVGDVNQILLSLGGVIQKPGTDFTVSGSTLTFTTAPAANTSFFAILLGSDNGGTVTPTDDSVTASKIASSLGGDIVFNEDSNDHDFRIEGNGDANAFFLDAEVDRIYLGHNADTDINGLNARLQISGTDFDKSSASLIRYSADANPPSIGFAKSRNASIAGNTIVQDGDNLGRIRFAGADGGDFANVAGQIDCQVDGTPGVNDMPGRLIFSTGADGATSATERVRIHSGGVMSASQGIALGVGTANTASNVLDDFEEGTWTASYGSSGSDTGYYTKIGRLVTLHVILVDTSQTFDQITGLPFSSNLATGAVTFGRLLSVGSGKDRSNVGGNTSGTILYLYDEDATSSSLTTGDGTVRLDITVTYLAS